MSTDSLEKKKAFWKVVFQETNLSDKLMDTGLVDEIAMDFQLPSFGNVHVIAKPAVPLGTNFMSDVFTTHAVLDNGTQFSAFIKVM